MTEATNTVFEEIEALRAGKIFVAGHRGLVGSAILRRLQRAGCTNLLLRTRSEIDLLNQADVRELFRAERPDYVFMAAAKVGGIHANNSYPADFIFENMTVTANVVHSAYEAGVTRLMNLGSSCIYPRMAPQPMKEDCLLTGPLEPTNEPYAIAKIAGIKLCESYNRQFGTDFRSVMPTNLYGPNDNFDLKTSHVLPALMRKFHEAKRSGDAFVEVWGSGKPRREFLHVDDLADACLFVMSLSKDKLDAAVEPMNSQVNIGFGEDVSIAELASLIAETVGFKGKIRYNSDYPDGMPRKLMDVGKLNGLGWRPTIGLREGLDSTYAWFRENFDR